MSSISARLLSSSVASRRRMPMLARIRGSGAYQPYIAARSEVVTISRVSSSWLRRNVPHWPEPGMSGVSARMSSTEPAFSSRSA